MYVLVSILFFLVCHSTSAFTYYLQMVWHNNTRLERTKLYYAMCAQVWIHDSRMSPIVQISGIFLWVFERFFFTSSIRFNFFIFHKFKTRHLCRIYRMPWRWVERRGKNRKILALDLYWKDFSFFPGKQRKIRFRPPRAPLARCVSPLKNFQLGFRSSICSPTRRRQKIVLHSPFQYKVNVMFDNLSTFDLL